MKKILFMIIFLLSACRTPIVVPDNFVYHQVKTSWFDIAAYTKITDSSAPYLIYIEGDGRAFYADGRISADPTPYGTLVREAAFGDTHPNVIYLARPCQYIMSEKCHRQYWSNARFSPEVIEAEYEAIRQLSGDAPKILIGYSGGAQVAGLLAVTKPDLNIRKIITIAGNLDHSAWTEYHNFPPLDQSMSLSNYRERFLSFPQIHYVGGKDKIIPPQITDNFINGAAEIIKIDQAGHADGWNEAIGKIYSE